MMVIPEFPQIALDSSQPVRAALAKILGPVIKSVGRDATQRQLLPSISDFLAVFMGGGPSGFNVNLDYDICNMSRFLLLVEIDGLAI